MTDVGAPPPPPGTGDGSPSTGDVKKVWWKRWWAIALGALIALTVIATIISPAEEEAVEEGDAADTTDLPIETEAPSETEPPATEAPTTTALATTTTEATTTTSTTSTTTTSTTTTTLPPEPVVYEGAGDSVIEIAFPDGGDVGILTISHSGGGNFSVLSLDAELERVDLLVNEIGSYQGTVLEEEGASFLEITAGGSWRIEANTVDQAPTFDESTTGLGDSVVLFTGESGIADITHAGDSNFAMWTYPLAGGRRDLLVNEIGNYTGSVRFPGPALIEITANGDWTISLQ